MIYKIDKKYLSEVLSRIHTEIESSGEGLPMSSETWEELCNLVREFDKDKPIADKQYVASVMDGQHKNSQIEIINRLFEQCKRMRNIMIQSCISTHNRNPMEVDLSDFAVIMPEVSVAEIRKFCFATRDGEGSVIAINKTNDELTNRIMELENIAPRKIKMEDGTYEVFHCPDHLIPETDFKAYIMDNGNEVGGTT